MNVIFLDYQSLLLFSLLDIFKRHNRNLKCRNRHSLTLLDLSIIFKQSGRHIALSPLVTLSISSLHNLDIEANKFYDRAH